MTGGGRLVAVLVPLLGAAFCPPTGVAGQSAALESAREAQRAFESVRRRHYERDGWPTRRCDEHVGRFCLDHAGDDAWKPGPEHDRVREARDRLIATLDSAHRVHPGDPWLAGQRVKYLLEAGDLHAAALAAAGCAGGRAWCEALRAFVLHRDTRFAAAERGFDRALTSMDAGERCDWEDIGDLLEGEDRSVYRDLSCGGDARRTFERRFWHLSDPLWSREGNERRVEHMARRVWRGIQMDAASGYGLRWGEDLSEITIRYGWPAGWDVAWRRDPGVRTERSIEAHRSPDAQRFAVRGSSGQPAWNLDDERPRSAWAFPDGRVSEPAGVQLAAFRRGDARIWVGSMRPVPEAACGEEIAMILSSGERTLGVGRGVAAVSLAEREPGAARIIGLESDCRGDRTALRVRAPAPDPGKWLSDLLLLDPVDELPGTLDATLPHVRPDRVVAPGEAIVVFWEWYGPPDPMSVTLTLSRENKGFWRKALEFVGLADRQIERAGVRWSEAGPGGEAPRSIRLELPELAEGEYSLTLQAQTARMGTVSSTQELVVRK